jgi:hypothetical protein
MSAVRAKISAPVGASLYSGVRFFPTLFDGSRPVVVISGRPGSLLDHAFCWALPNNTPRAIISLSRWLRGFRPPTPDAVLVFVDIYAGTLFNIREKFRAEPCHVVIFTNDDVSKIVLPTFNPEAVENENQ